MTFSLVMPAVEGATWLRVSLYHRDNLLETFLLDLLVEEAERTHPRTVLSAHLQHSATRDWGNLDALGGRALSLTLNADPAGGHRLFLKGHDAPATLPVDEQREEALAGDVRQTLTMLVDRKLGSAAAVWKLASKGGELLRRLFEQADDPARAALGLVAQSADQAVQVVRAHLDRAVPWSLIYDWPLPRVLYGAPDPPVCFGRTESGDRCAHRFDDKKVCVYGFWGIRHRVEELLADPSKAPAFLAALTAMARPGARVVAQGTAPYGTTDPVHRDYHERNRRRGRMGGQLRLRVRHRELATGWFDYLLCTPEELDRLVSGTGWRVAEIDDADSPQYVAVLRLA